MKTKKVKPRNPRYYHVTPKDYGDTVVFEPRIPESACDEWEDVKTPRICFAPTLEGCLMSASGVDCWIQGLSDMCSVRKKIGKKPSIYVPELPVYVYAIHGNSKVRKITTKKVRDVKLTGEVWRLAPVKLTKVGVIDPRSVAAKDLIVKWL